MLHDILHESRKLRVKRAEAILRRIDSGQIKEARGQYSAWLPLIFQKGFRNTARRQALTAHALKNLKPASLNNLNKTNGTLDLPSELNFKVGNITVDKSKSWRVLRNNDDFTLQYKDSNGNWAKGLDLTPADQSLITQQLEAMNAFRRQGMKAVPLPTGYKRTFAGGGAVGLGAAGLGWWASSPSAPPPPGMTEDQFNRYIETMQAMTPTTAGTPGDTTQKNTNNSKGSIVPWLLGLTAIGGLGLGAYSLMKSKDNSSKSITDVRDMEQALEAERERRRRRKQLAAYTAANTSAEDRKMLPAPEPKEEVTYAF